MVGETLVGVLAPACRRGPGTLLLFLLNHPHADVNSLRLRLPTAHQLCCHSLRRRRAFPKRALGLYMFLYSVVGPLPAAIGQRLVQGPPYATLPLKLAAQNALCWARHRKQV